MTNLRRDPRDLLRQIDQHKSAIDGHRPLTSAELKELDDYHKIGLTYSSNALEGNSLTITETKVLLEDGLTVGGKPMRDALEAIGHAAAYDFMLAQARQHPLLVTENTIKRLHKLFYQGIDPEQAGEYRARQVFITGTDFFPPSAEDIPAIRSAIRRTVPQADRGM
ncbi:MAG: hypothetical protein FWD74_03265 [Actinomycetia bacterium]|nr:hypothetical protein [Actinomycetes bacterium]